MICVRLAQPADFRVCCRLRSMRSGRLSLYLFLSIPSLLANLLFLVVYPFLGLFVHDCSDRRLGPWVVWSPSS